MAKPTGENPRATLRKASAARLRRARAEDRLDRAWLEECHKVLSEAVKERGTTELQALLDYARTPLPPRPAGFEERQRRCNRCGNATKMNWDFDALFCRRCNRWIDAKCSQPDCQFCGRRPRKPLP
jgi:hypothetical protein